MRLNYGCFAQVMFGYYSKKITNKDLAQDLLCASAIVGDLDKSTACRYNRCQERVPYRDEYEEKNDPYAKTRNHFKTKIIKNINPRRIDSLVSLMQELIEKDEGNSQKQTEQKASLHELAQKIDCTIKPEVNDALAEFLSRTFIYAVLQENKLTGAKLAAFKEFVDNLKGRGEASAKTAHPTENLLFKRNKFFIGRDAYLKQIHESFRSCETMRTQVITGLGGVGKTQLALEYAYRYKAEYAYMCWITASDDATSQNSIRDFLLLIKAPEAEASENARRVAFVKWLDSQEGNAGRWLLIFDNADGDMNLIRPYLPKNENAKGDILITTRLQTGYDDIIDGEAICVSTFSEAEAVAFLLCRTGLKDEDGAATLAWRLGYLPLALEQAGAYVAAKHTKTDFTSYVALLKQYGLSLFEQTIESIDYTKSVTATWQISMRKIVEPGAKQLINIIAYFASYDIPVAVFEEFAEYLPEPLRSDMQNGLKRAAILGELTRYSLVKVEDDKLSIHRLLQDVIVKNMVGINFLESFIDIIFQVCLLEKDGTYKDFYRVVHHVEALCILPLDQEDIWTQQTSEKLVYIWHTLAAYYFFIGDSEKAIFLYKFLIDTCERAINPFSDFMIELHVDAYERLAHMYCGMEEYDLATAITIKGIEFFEDRCGVHDSRIAVMYDVASRAYEGNGEFKSALEWSRKALKVREAFLEPGDYRILHTKKNMINLYDEIGEEKIADTLYKEVQETWESIPKDSLEEEPWNFTGYFELCCNMGFYKDAIWFYKDAIYWGEKILDLRLESQDIWHPVTMNCFFYLGALYRVTGEYQKAMRYLDEIVLGYQMLYLGADHKRTKRTLDEIQRCKEEMDNPSDTS